MEVKDAGFMYLAEGQTAGYTWLNRYFLTFSIAGDGEKHQRGVKEFINLAAQKIGQPYRKKGSASGGLS